MADLYDDEEDFDASDTGDDSVPDGTAAILYAEKLEILAQAGFPRTPGDEDGHKLQFTNKDKAV